MAEDDAWIARAARPRGLRVLHLPDPQELRPHEARFGRPRGHSQGDENRPERRLEQRNDREHEQKKWKAQHELDEARYDPIRGSAVVASDSTEERPHHERERRCKKSYGERDARTVNHSRQNIPSHIICAKQMLRPRREETAAQVDRIRRIRGKDRRRYSDQRHDADEHERRRRHPAPPKPPPHPHTLSLSSRTRGSATA